MNTTTSTQQTRLRYLAVVTYGDGSGSQLVEYTGNKQIARRWLARSRRWARTVTVDTLNPGLKDVRAALPHDLKRYHFTLGAGQVLA